jgi:hypothetical protein
VITNLRQVHKAYERFNGLYDRTLFDIMQDTAVYGVRYANARPRYTPRTGKLSRSNEARFAKGRRVGTVKFRNRQPYARAIDEGARPHDIRPKNPNGRLVFFWKKLGKWVFARRVKHPGNRPYRFLHGAAIAAGQKLTQQTSLRLSRLAKTSFRT